MSRIGTVTVDVDTWSLTDRLRLILVGLLNCPVRIILPRAKIKEAR